MMVFKKIKRKFQKITGPLLCQLRSPELTILGYHRIADPVSKAYHGYRGLASATAESFSKQLEFIGENRNPIEISDVLACLSQGQSLPPKSVLLTFDDGYADNFEAAKAMDEHGIKGIFFIPTAFVGGNKCFSWDFASEAILHSKLDGQIDLPLVGACDFSGNREKTIHRFVKCLEPLSYTTKVEVLSELAELLEVPASGPAPNNLHMTWQQLTTLRKNGHTIAPHTTNHTSMTALSKSEATNEIVQAKAEIESRKLGHSDCFAYPYGQKAHHSTEVEALLRDHGFKIAFTAYGGFSSAADLKSNPLAARRVMISNCNKLEDFKTKLAWG